MSQNTVSAFAKQKDITRKSFTEFKAPRIRGRFSNEALIGVAHMLDIRGDLTYNGSSVNENGFSQPQPE